MSRKAFYHLDDDKQNHIEKEAKNKIVDKAQKLFLDKRQFYRTFQKNKPKT